MPLFDLPQEMRILRGTAINQLTDDEFFDVYQSNPAFRLERTAQHDSIFRSPADSESSEFGGESYGQLWLWNRSGHHFD